MKTITLRDMPILSEPSYRYHIMPNGEMVDVYDVRYDSKVDIENLKFISIADEGYKDCTLPTLNELYANGTLTKEGTCIEREHRVDFRNMSSLNDSDINLIIAKFKENGFNVTKEAIQHNFEAWRYDMKSGYRDEVNNYHLFSPCGCNPLSFRVTTLHKQCEDWQTTYTC
jgi:hypothetical protein